IFTRRKTMDKQTKEWKRMQFKTNKVWVATTPDGNLREKNGKVLLKYQLGQDYEYWVHRSSVTPIDNETLRKKTGKAAPSGRKSARKKTRTGKKDTPPKKETYPPHTVCIYTDGASSGNPGPSGIGVLLRFEDHEKEISRSIGIATNNIAELEAIRAGLMALKKTRLPVRVHTDSSYALGVLTRGWKAKKNTDLIESIQQIMSTFDDLKFIKVKGHAGMAENERADTLATQAVSRANGEPG
ncbi:MAG: ribonuclease H, partial [Desulfobacterales bacterium]